MVTVFSDIKDVSNPFFKDIDDVLFEIKSGNNVKILRRENVIGEGKVKEVQTQKIKASSVKEGDEFGMMVDSKMEIVEGDVVRSMEMVRQE